MTRHPRRDLHRWRGGFAAAERLSRTTGPAEWAAGAGS
jgi:hypothetical protein